MLTLFFSTVVWISGTIILFTGDNPPALVKKGGKMTYIVCLHFSETSTNTFEDKVKRMLREEIQRMEM